MGSLVVFPFKTERPDVVLKNVAIAAHHESVDEVLCVGSDPEATYRAVEEAIPAIVSKTATPVGLVLQDRIGTKRRGKGDGMNTGLRHFIDSDCDRLHFYDADITSFDDAWITKAEKSADLGYDMVRHYFPRSATDGMVTWMITRPGFAILFPNSELPYIHQPLGGELVLSRKAAETIASDSNVARQSDWGIDTLITFSAVQHGMSISEVYIPQGKIHKLYGQLTDIRRMVIECFSAVQALRDQVLDRRITLDVQRAQSVPESITKKTGYDFEATMRLIPKTFTSRQLDVLATLPTPVMEGMLTAHTGNVSFLEESLWHDVYLALLDEYIEGDDDWEEMLFLVWVVRVLAYTTDVARTGYDGALEYLEGTIRQYRERSVGQTRP
ncbi:MAG: mannosylglycerate synthase domain-containing protein [Acidimicrobiia bacterium]